MSNANHVCAYELRFRSACRGLAANWEVDGKNYCVLHCPANNKLNQFVDVLHKKLASSDFDFRGVYFPNDVTFQTITFSSNACFDNAEFSGDADFSRTTFSTDVSFSSTKFRGGASFSSATFSRKVDFSSATFCNWADFIQVTVCGDAKFLKTTFCCAANFNDAKIESYLEFSGTKQNPVFAETALLSLQFAKITKPEQIIFHSVKLRHHWFVNVDSRKFEFTNIDWGKTTIRDELQSLEKVENRHRLLSIAYRQLATNAEDNNRYTDAAHFRYASMDARRLEQWRGWDIFTLDWWYWLVSGYGERIPRAMICLLVLLLGFSFLFTKVGFETKATSEVAPVVQEMMQTPAPRKDLPLPSFLDGLTYAMSAALFQRPEPKAYTICAKLSVGTEMILVPLQAALLALAIRRRFMR